MPQPDVIIIGGGVIGLSLACRLARETVRVLLLERGQLGAAASSAAAGMLAAQAENAAPGPFFDLCLDSRERYADLAAQLRDEVGLDVGYRTEGFLLPFNSDTQLIALRDRFGWQQQRSLPMEWLDEQAARDAEPRLDPSTRGALLLPQDRQVDNRRLVAALIQACRKLGVDLRTGIPVIAIRAGDSHVTGVDTIDGPVPAPAVVNAAGAWAGTIAGPRTELTPPVRPIKGQMIALEASTEVRCNHIIKLENAYLVPRHDGRIVVGATMEDVGFDERITAGAIEWLLSTAIDAFPALGALPIIETWAGLRPSAPDSLPILGPTALEGYYLAAAHHRNGILLATATAELLATAIISRKTPYQLAPFALDRFTRNSAHA